jgi:hypothetical protein
VIAPTPATAARRRALLLAPLLLLGACGPATRSSEASRAAPPATAQALRVYRDPSTGAFTEPPPGERVAAPAAAPAAPAALIEEAAPGGGRMIRLRGAFHSHFVAGADGVSCTTSRAAPARP